MTYVLAVDIGGTFTDSAIVDEQGRLTVAKAFSTPHDFSVGILDSLRVAAGSLGVSLEDLLADARLFLHSTSIAENAIVDGTLVPAGLLATRGFEHTVQQMRGGYGRWSGLTEDEKKDLLAMSKPELIIPLPMSLPIRERTDSQGEILAAPDDAEVIAAVRTLVGLGAAAIGICFLWSFRNPTNEEAVRRTVEREFPELFVTTSSELAPREGEYERMSTVALNARLGPIVRSYLERLTTRLATSGFTGTMMVMQAHGGLIPAEEAPARAVGLIESGPAGGLIGSRAIGDQLGLSDILATDMGGTTFKVGVIRGGRIENEREPRVYRYHYALDKLAIVSIGLAGGSIVSVEPDTGVPKVGPRSAGADPGPVCYGFGATEPTVADVDLLLGYLDERHFLGGRARLDRQAAEQAFATTVAEPLGMTIPDAARSVYRLTNSILFDLLHRETVQKGIDPRGYTMFVYGGAGGMHLPAIARALGVKQVVVPHSASVQGAFGLVSADMAYTDSASRPFRVPAPAAEIAAVFDGLESRLVARLVQAGFHAETIGTERAIDMRYARQVHTIATPVAAGQPITAATVNQAVSRFEELYAERFGAQAGYREAGIEMVTYRVRATAPLNKPAIAHEERTGADPIDAYVESRRAYFSSISDLADARCYDYERLRPGNVAAGPAIVWTPTTTVVVEPGQSAELDTRRDLVITWA